MATKLSLQTMLKQIVANVRSLHMSVTPSGIHVITADLAGGTTKFPGRFIHVSNSVLINAVRLMHGKVVKSV